MKRSKDKRIVIYKKEPNFDIACLNAYDQALIEFGVDDSGHFGILYKEDFPRSMSMLTVAFKFLEVVGGMGGQNYKYFFDAWIEKIEEVDET